MKTRMGLCLIVVPFLFAVIIAGLEGQKNWLTLLFWMGHKSHLPGPGMGLFDRSAGTTSACPVQDME